MCKHSDVSKHNAMAFPAFIIILLCVFCLTPNTLGSSLDEQLESMGLDKKMFQYKDLFVLTSSNFSSLVLDSFDPWVVVMHRGVVSAQWKEAAVKSRGVVWFGMVNLDTEKHVIKEMTIKNPDKITKEEDRARVYPFGHRSVKMKKYMDVTKANAALGQAVMSLPMDSITHIKDAEDLNDFIMDGIITNPSRFPAIFIYGKGEFFPPEFTSISIHLKRYFNFGRLDTRVAKELVSVGVDGQDLKASRLIVIVSKLDDKGELIQKGIRCKERRKKTHTGRTETEEYAMQTYPELLECLYNINSRFRSQLPGNNMADDEEVAMMEDVMEQEQRRFQLSGDRQPALMAQVGRMSPNMMEALDNKEEL